MTVAPNPRKGCSTVKTAVFGASSRLPPLVERRGRLVWSADAKPSLFLALFDAKQCRDSFQRSHSCDPSPLLCSATFRSSSIRILLPRSITQPPQSGPGVNTTHTGFHTFFALFVHLLCFYGWWLSKLGSGHWHPPVNPRETDPGSGIPGSHLVSFPTSGGKAEMRRQGTGGGGKAYLWVFGGHAGMADLQ